MKNVLLLSALVLSACAEDVPPAIVVGTVSFAEDQLLGLSDARRNTLIDLAAFGLAVADSSTSEMGAPRLGRMYDDALLGVLAAELTLEEHGVDDAVLEARYLTDPDYELTVRHILFFSERWRTADHRAQARAKASRALEALKAGADFAETAAQLSEEPGAEGRAGLLTPGREGAWVDEFWAAASVLGVGDVSPVTETQYGFHILRLEGRSLVPFAEARGRVARDVADRIDDPVAVLGAYLDRQPEIFLAEDVIEASMYDSFGATALIASWDGGQLAFGEYLTWAADQSASWNSGGLGSDRESFRRSIAELARRRQGLDEAERRGLTLSPVDVGRANRAWDDDVNRWSTALGFIHGATPGEVAEAALAALARTGQGAMIAREELADRAPLLRARYEVRVAGSMN
jgi:hypothetical protein